MSLYSMVVTDADNLRERIQALKLYCNDWSLCRKMLALLPLYPPTQSQPAVNLALQEPANEVLMLWNMIDGTREMPVQSLPMQRFWWLKKIIICCCFLLFYCFELMLLLLVFILMMSVAFGFPTWARKEGIEMFSNNIGWNLFFLFPVSDPIC